MGNKISQITPDNIDVIDVINEPSQMRGSFINDKKDDNPQSSSKKTVKKPQKNNSVLLSGLFVLDDEYDYGQYVSFTDEYSKEPTGGFRQNQEGRRRNAIHPHLLDIVQSQFQVQQQQHGCYMLAEQ